MLIFKVTNCYMNCEEIHRAIGWIELPEKEEIKKNIEGKGIQILHIWPESLAKMRKLIEQKNLVENGLHHEIYLSDPRKIAPEKMKTILRQPVK